jgi:hypothetical protein
MRIVLTIFLLSTLLGMSSQSIEGCLQYSNASGTACKVCDNSNFYYLNGILCNRASDIFCSQINSSGQCLSCFQGYFLSNQKVCLPILYICNCLDYANDGSISWCQTCEDGYELMNSACIPIVTNCFQFSWWGSCIQCNDGFTLTSEGTCNGGIPNCLTYASPLVCQACETGYGLTITNTQCINTIPFCVLYNASKLCLKCATNYTVANNGIKCNPKTPTCNTGQSYCASSNTCVLVPICCATHDGCGNCLTFKPMTGWSSKNKVCYTIPSNCPTSFDPDTLLCKCTGTAIWVESTKKCVNIPSCCQEYDIYGVCFCFKTGTGWCAATNSCYQIPLNCPSHHDCATLACTCPVGQIWNSIQNICIEVPWCCATYDIKGNCLTLKDHTGWSSTLNSCFNIPPQCLYGYDPNLGTCICPSNQKWCSTLSQCVVIPDCCATSDDCGKCITFKTNTGWCSATNQCYTKPVVCPFNHNCQTGVCTCNPGYIWNSTQGACVLIPTCCDTSDITGHCITFKPQTGWCVATDSCYNIPALCPNKISHDCATGYCTCPTGQTWCSARSTCVTVLQCCSKSDNCGNCLQFKANKGYCENTKSCYNIPQDCPISTSHDCSTGNCICPNGWIWNSTKKTCVLIPSCCQTWDNLGNCLTFKTGTGWCSLTNACYFIPTSCPSNHNCSTNECTCPTGSTWCVTAQQCIETPICCESNDNCGVCKTIKQGYTLCPSTKKCVSLPVDCPNDNDGCGNCKCNNQNQSWCSVLKKCTNNPTNCLLNDKCGSCTTCMSGFYLVSGVCLPPNNIPHCSIYSLDFQKCITCDIYYSLVNGGLGCHTTNCLDYSLVNNICNLCEDSFMLIPGFNICITTVPECFEYLDFTFGQFSQPCNKCRFPYYIDKINNKCTINRCKEYDSTSPVLTCKTCFVPQLKSPSGYICFPAIEKCSQYSVTNTSYKCQSCEIGYKLNSAQSLCVSGVYFIGGLSGGAFGSVFSGSGFGMFASSSQSIGYALSWGTVDFASEFFMWYLTSYDGVFYTMRLQVLKDGIMAPFYLTQSGTSLNLTLYFTLNNNIKWILEQANPGNNDVWYIKAYQTGLYMGYGLELSTTPTPFYFK